MLAIANSAAVNIGEYTDFQIMVFSRCMPTSVIVGSYGISVQLSIKKILIKNRQKTEIDISSEKTYR